MRRGGALADLQPGTLDNFQHGTLADFYGDFLVVYSELLDIGGFHVAYFAFPDTGGFHAVYVAFFGIGSAHDYGSIHQSGLLHWVIGYFGIYR